MTRNLRRLLPMLLAGALALAVPAFGAQYEIDAAHTVIGFKVKHLAISNVKGSFGDFSGKFSFDAAAPADASAEIVIQVASITTGIAKRDEHLRSPDFFDVAQFPTITFKSTGLAMSSANEGVLTGVLTMHGISRDITLDVTFNGAVKDPWGNDRAGFSATGKLDRRDFGLTYGAVIEGGGLVVGNDVELTLEVEGIMAK